MIIQATKKLQDMLKIKTMVKPIDDNNFSCWHANIFNIGRKKGLLVTHNTSLYSVFIYGITQKKLKDLPSIIKQRLELHLSKDLFTKTCIDEMLKSIGDIEYMNTSKRSVTGSMNEMTKFIDGFFIEEDEAIGVRQDINNMIYGYLDYFTPHESLKCDLLNVNNKSEPLDSNFPKEALFVKIECINEHHDHKSYKKVEIKADMPLSELYRNILKMFDFDNDHMHQFYLSKTGAPYNRENIILNGAIDSDDMDSMDPEEQYDFEETITVKEAMDMEPSLFLCMIFDFGDDWIFKISKYKKEVEFDSKKEYPFVVKAVGDNPVQYPDIDQDLDDE